MRDASPFVRTLLVPAIAITAAAAMVIALGRSRSARVDAPAPERRADGKQLMPLVAKDDHYNVIPPARGGATGSVWYSPSGDSLALELRASGLAPRQHLVAELVVDGDLFSFARLIADSSGNVAFDTTLVQLASDRCASGATTKSRSLDGEHEIKFWVRRDGAPRSATACGGNGDGDDRRVLYEAMTQRFVGTR